MTSSLTPKAPNKGFFYPTKKMARPKKPSGNAINYTPKIECSEVLDKCGNKTAFIDSAVLHYSKFLAEGNVVVSAEELEAVKEMINKL